MQNTRLNNIINGISTAFFQFFSNPWRQFSLLIIGFWLGFFLGGSAITSTFGQTGAWDAVSAAILIVIFELIGAWVYSRQRDRANSRYNFLVNLLNVAKIGAMYGLALEAFKLNT